MMKKQFTLMFMFITAFSSTINAAPDNLEANSKIAEAIYCPESVTCTGAGTQDSCTFKTNHPEYWGSAYSGKGFPAGNYGLDYVLAGNRSKFFLMVNCQYKDRNKDLNASKWVSVSSKPIANLEAPDNNPNWKPYKYNHDDLICSSNSLSCPLRRQSALIIHNKNIRDGVSASANGIGFEMTVATPDGQHVGMSVGAGQDVKLLYDDALASCGAADICQIDITSPKGAAYGYVYVDMTKHMDILSVHAWRPSTVNIRQIDSFNAIEVSYSAG